jgi:hypothetical protein
MALGSIPDSSDCAEKLSRKCQPEFVLREGISATRRRNHHNSLIGRCGTAQIGLRAGLTISKSRPPGLITILHARGAGDAAAKPDAS